MFNLAVFCVALLFFKKKKKKRTSRICVRIWMDGWMERKKEREKERDKERLCVSVSERLTPSLFLTNLLHLLKQRTWDVVLQ